MDNRRVNGTGTGRNGSARGPVRSEAGRRPSGTAGSSRAVTVRQNQKSRSVVPAKMSTSKMLAIAFGRSMRAVVRGSMSAEKNDEKLKTVKSSNRKPFPVSVVLLALIITGLFMFMILSYVQINEYTIEVSGLRSELSELAANRKELTYRIDEKNDMLEIEKYATENLHMVKADQLSKKHITIDREDKIEVVEPEPTEDHTVVTTMMSAVFSNFNGLVEYWNK